MVSIVPLFDRFGGFALLASCTSARFPCARLCSGAGVQQIDIMGKSLKLRQIFFDEPVPQPRGGRRIHADLSGLKLWPSARPMLLYLLNNALPRIQQEAGRPMRILEVRCPS